MKRIFEPLFRVRGITFLVSAAILVLNVVVLNLPLPDVVRQVWVVILFTAFGLFIASGILTLLGPALEAKHPVHRVVSPVRGRWLALNSPATKVPSHGVRLYGQSHAIDLVAEPETQERPEFGTGVSMRAPGEYPAQGEGVYAMIDGEVVRVTDGQRDHRARSTLLDVLYMNVEALVRSIGGPRFVIGNHVTIRGDNGVYATIAHLQQGSAKVDLGDRVEAGQLIGRCGNSGNSSEPHVHAQLSDRKGFHIANGIPMTFADIALGDGEEIVHGVPATGEHMVASVAPAVKVQPSASKE